MYQEFSHVATPEDNAYIEARHSNLQREVIDRFEFEQLPCILTALNSISRIFPKRISAIINFVSLVGDELNKVAETASMEAFTIKSQR